MNMSLKLLLPSVLLMACSGQTEVEPYYSSEDAVSVSSLTINSEAGNMGGQEVVINGSGFGTAINGVTVLFGNQNAESIVSVADDAITVISPRGPVSGGTVDVRVGNTSGQDSLYAAYTYEVPGNGLNGEDSQTKQIAYVSVNNDTLSCYGGIHSGISGCEGFAYTGSTGIEGGAQGLEFFYPKSHMPNFGGKGGFAGSTDISWEKWHVTDSPRDVNSFDDENNVEDMRIELGAITLTNPALASQGTWCADLVSFADFTYNGSDDYVPKEDFLGNIENPELADAGLLYGNTSVSPGGSLQDYYGANGSCYAGGKEYLLSELQFCQVKEYQEGNTFKYEAEWPNGINFFQGVGESNSLDSEAAIAVNLKVERALPDGLDIQLPPYAKFTNVASGSDSNWAIGELHGACPDTDGDRLTTLNDSAFTWEWEPVEWDCDSTEEGSLCASDENSVRVHSYVKVNVTYFSFSWIGGEGLPLKATISVPDDNNYDPETGKSSVDLPAWVLYSFPSASMSMGFQQAGGFGGDQVWTDWGDPLSSNYGYLVISLDRVTEYSIPTTVNTDIGGQTATVNGDFVFAYATGDVGLFEFDNPLDSDDGCSDCLDNDGDGWTDALDPDCADGDTETAVTSDSTCNNGLDDDGDGDIDSADSDCVNGMGGESEECSNNIDDDADGWMDLNDPDCQNGGIFEDSLTSDSTCNNGLDDDGDGWIDSQDFACQTANDDESDGFNSELPCNDGIDNDGHGDIDFADPYCQRQGSDAEGEEPSFLVNCIDGEDNDGDGYIDANDPDCELTRVNENSPFLNPQDHSWVSECYDGIDNDCDGFTDAEDSSCINALGEPDGFSASESGDGFTGVCNCDDADDNDNDGWIDLDDPDCNGSDYGTEVGPGSSVCNDLVDNDGDGAIDSLDLVCVEEGAEHDDETKTFVAACADEADNDSDGWIDALDPDCELTRVTEDDSIPNGYELSLPCNDDIDNDGDGLTDENDPGCLSGLDASEVDSETDCVDGSDEDADGAIDCADTDCASDAACQ